MNLEDEIKIIGIDEPAAREAVKYALNVLNKKLPEATKNMIRGLTITICDGLTDSGDQAFAEKSKIILDKQKNSLSLQVAENYLVQAGYLEKGDWTNVLPEVKDRQWSCLIYQIVHEVMHIIDGKADGKKYNRLSVDKSPTKYGKSKPNEAFAEAATYWVFEKEINPKTKKLIEDLFSRSHNRNIGL